MGGAALRVFFLPLMSPGHMIPMIDMAKLFAARGPDVSATIITTPGNEPLVRPSISSLPIELLLVPFPPSSAHLLRDGKENLASMPFADFPRFFEAFCALQAPIEELLLARRPNCIVSDYLFHWTADTAVKLNIPRIIFYGHGIFPSCVHESLHAHRQHEKAADDSETFVVEGLPHRIELRRSEVSIGVIYPAPGTRESVGKSFGVAVNSFYELEPEYADLYRSGGGGGRRAYYVGPVSLSSEHREEVAGPDLEGLMRWLDSMGEGSVVYVCFGSLNEFSADQMREIAAGLEGSGRASVWAVRGFEREYGAEWLPEGKGVVIRGWAPQTAILNHPAVGGFVTHCGWNSALESVAAGVPMVTWPVEYEQFVNEKLIVQVLGIGVSVGRGEPVGDGGKGMVKAGKIAEAVMDVMGGGGPAEERRGRGRKYAALAKAAKAEGGSSYDDMSRLIEDIKAYSDRGI